MEFLRILFKRCVNPIIIEFPLFSFTFCLLNPFWISGVKSNPLNALASFCCVHNVVSCDLYVTILFAWSFVFIINLCGERIGKFAKLFSYVLLISSFIIRKFLLWEFDMDYSPASISLFMETDGAESIGFVKTFILSSTGIKYAILLVAIVVTVVVGEKAWNKWSVKYFSEKAVHVSVSIVAIVFVVMGLNAIGYHEELLRQSGQNTITGIYSSLKTIKDHSKDGNAFYENVLRVKEMADVSKCNLDNINVVFVLGESFNKTHASNYGYKLETTPNVEKEIKSGNLFVFYDVVSPFNSTTPSLKNILCLNDVSKDEKWYQHVFWPQLFKQAGYNVYVWDNQKSYDQHYTGAFYEMYSNKVCKYCYTKMNTNSYEYDGDALKHLFNENDFKKGRNFVLFHMKGQHFDFEDKCPDEFRKFSWKDIERSESYLTKDKLSTISHYDNAIRYNDYVLEELFEKLRNTCSVVLFLSDHGEEIYDYRDKGVRAPMDENMIAEYAHNRHDTPFYIWCSNAYKTTNDFIMKEIAQSAYRKYSSDKVGHTMLHLGHVTTLFYNKEYDVLNKSYKEGKRLIYYKGDNRFMDYQGHLDYDSIVGTFKKK